MRDERRSPRGAQELARTQRGGRRSLFDPVEGGLLMCWEIKRCFHVSSARYSGAGNAAANTLGHLCVTMCLKTVFLLFLLLFLLLLMLLWSLNAHVGCWITTRLDIQFFSP